MKFLSTRCVFGISVVTVAMWALLFTNNARALEAQLKFKLESPDPQSNGGFGTVLATLDGQIVVGEPWRRGPTPSTPGRVYAFDGESGTLNLTIENPQQANGVTFGEYLTAGDGQIFVTGRWGQQQSVFAYDLASGAVNYVIGSPESTLVEFGYGITYGGGDLFVAAPGYDNAPFQNVGKVYRYDAATGSLEGEIDSPIQAPSIFGFWRSLAAVDDRVIIASGIQNQAWAFDSETSAILFSLDRPDPGAMGSVFGFPIAASNDLIAFGAIGDSTGSGAVYLFDGATGEYRHKLTSPNAEYGGHFGFSVAITPQGDVLVGAESETVDGESRVGRAYLFDGSTGNLLLEITNPEPARHGMFGWAVAAFDDLLVIGRRDASDGLPFIPGGSGAVYVFRVVPEPNALCVIIFCGVVLMRCRPRR